ncbi:MAG: sugar ABC transporter ATP-binding protein [Clostridiales bacterium]|nr:sugar ABC transporter ATP-binding protein [Clostridiales bacterium]
MEAILKAEGITKTFPGVKALSGVSMEIRPGEVVALLGENGAGKSTLIKILAGAQQPNSGKISIDGKPVRFASPDEAKAAGISVVYQELTNIPELSVAENLFINRYGGQEGFLRWRSIYQEAERAVEAIGLKIDVRRQMGLCSVAEKQQIEIARAMYEKARVLILDEPTSALNDTEISHLLEKIRMLKAAGVGIVLITHKMDEIFAISDSVVVLRDGVTVAEKRISEVTEPELIRLMVGREIGDMYPEKGNALGETILNVRDLRNRRIRNVSFSLRRGEILGVYGLMGSGHHELGRALFGCAKGTRGSVELEGRPLRLANPKKCLQAGIAYVPGERKLEGLVLIQSVAGNIMTAYYETGEHGFLINYGVEAKIVDRWIGELSIKTPGPNSPAATLSGGNQQKVVLAKWLEVAPKIIILNEPTRGIDVGTKADIYHLLNTLCERGVSIIMITSEMPELLAMSDNVLVMHEGAQQAIFGREELSETNIMAAAIGG